MLDPITVIREKLKSIVGDTPERVDLLNDLAWHLRVRTPESAITTASSAFELAKKIKYDRGIAFGKRNLALVAYFDSDFPTAFKFFDEALTWFEANDERYGAGTIYNSLGMAHWSFGDFQKGIEYTLRSLEIAREFNDQAGEAWILNALGGYHMDMNQLVDAQKYFEESCQIFEKIELATGIARSYVGLGNVLAAGGQFDRAMALYCQSLELDTQMGNDLGKSRSLNDLGLLHQKKGQLKLALKYLKKSLKLRSQLSYTVGEATTLLNIGDLYVEMEKNAKAQTFYLKGLKSAEAALSKPKMVRAYRGLAVTAKAQGKLDKALEYHELFHELEEQVYHEDTNSRLKNMQAIYRAETAQKEAEIYRLKNVELKATNTQLQETIQRLNAAQAQLIQAGKMAALGKLVAGIAHELNNPIGSIHGAADVNNRGIKRVAEWVREHKMQTDNSLEKTLDIISRNNENILSATKRVTGMVNNLKRFSRIDSAETQVCYIEEELDNTLEVLKHEIGERISIRREYSESIGILCNPAELNQVLMNLLLNAIEAIEEQGKITIRTRVFSETVQVDIEDSGRGIPESMLANLFQPDFTVGKERVKMSTGLYNSYLIVEKGGGTINVRSKPGKGTTFTVIMPYARQQTNTSENIQ